MIRTLIHKELRAILLSPKFAATFAALSILILLSVYIGIQNYQENVRQYEAAQKLSEQRLREASGWLNISTRVYRAPDPMQIFASGLNLDIGRWSDIERFEGIRLEGSNYSEDTLFAVFRFIDFSLIVQVVLSLLALLFTYDAICGEKEDGTLRLIFANSVGRAQYLLGKCLGIWLGLVIPLCIPILLSFLLLQLFGIPFTMEHWLRLAALTGASLLFFTVFIILGLMISAASRRPSVSFLASLVLWIILVLIVPRAALLTASQMTAVPSAAEIEAQIDKYSKEKWDEFFDESAKMARAWKAEHAQDEPSEDQQWREATWEDSLRKAKDQQIDDYQLKLRDDLRRKRAEQERLALNLARISPASVYHLVSMKLARNDIDLKNNFEDAMNTYRTSFLDHADQMAKASKNMGGIMIMLDSDSGLSIKTSRDQGALDLSGLPKFAPAQGRLADDFSETIMDLTLLTIYLLTGFVIAFVMFMRYDLR